MKHLFTILSLLAVNFIYSQNAEISGTITASNSGDPLSGASVRYDKTKGVVTDADGRYKISLPEGQYDIVFNTIGYKKQKLAVTVTAGEKKTMDIKLAPDAFEFNQVTTTSLYKKNAAKENVSTSVVTSEQIKHTNSNDLADALSRTSGVLVQDGQITIRGGSGYSYGVGSRTAVLQDGLSLMSADLGQGQNTMAELENAKQIEVIKGASSVVYGSSALNGVVNVITDWPTEDTPRTTIDINGTLYGNTPKPAQNWWKPYHQWWSSFLPFGTDINFNHRRKIKNVQFMTGGNLTALYSYLQGNNDARGQLFMKTRYVSPKIEGLSFGVDGTAQFEKIQEFFLSKDLDTNAFLVAAGSTSRYLRFNADPHLSYYSAKGHTYNLKMRYMNINRIGNGNDPNAVSHQILMDNQYQYKWKSMFVLTAGAPFGVGISRSNLYTQTHITFNVAVYSQLEFNYKRLSVQAGLRYEVQKVDNDLETGRPIFRSGLNYRVGKATFLRGSWGQAYRIPSIGERDILQNFATGIQVVPNDTLHPEQGWSSEIGINQGFKIGKNFVGFVDLAVYYNQYKEFTQYDFGSWQNRFAGSGETITTDTNYLNHLKLPSYNPYPATPLNQMQMFGIQAHNIENARIFGYEFTFGGRGNIGPVGITASGGYSYNYGASLPVAGDKTNRYTEGQFFSDAFKYNVHRVQDTSTAAYKNLLEYRVRHLIHIDIELRYWRFYIGGTFFFGSFPEIVPATIATAVDFIANNPNALSNYVQQHQFGDYTGDMRVGCKVSKRFDVGFIVKNIGNRYYELRPGKPEPVRNYTLQLRYNF